MTGKTSTPLYNTTSNFRCLLRPGPSKCEPRILSYSTNDAVTQDRYLHTRCSMTEKAATVQLCKTKGQFLLTYIE